jgi:hypothetical protein
VLGWKSSHLAWFRFCQPSDSLSKLDSAVWCIEYAKVGWLVQLKVTR